MVSISCAVFASSVRWMLLRRSCHSPAPLAVCSFHCLRRVAWCHGGAGYVLLLLKAAEVLGDPGGRYGAAAAAADEDIWRRGLLRKASRCRLGAGMQYACCYCCMLLNMQTAVAHSLG
jgi:hypothetical protein